ncbi:hypothetical protein PBI_NEBKISS_150 [Mycobacterium phage Nebkiss]|nr:hypothetical protein PBI_NEBKISS_150 [Mycobacterium phage Nebkiss]
MSDYMVANGFINDLRDTHPNADLTARCGNAKYGITCKAHTLIQDFDYLASEANYWRAEALKWQRVAQGLVDKLGPSA